MKTSEVIFCFLDACLLIGKALVSYDFNLFVFTVNHFFVFFHILSLFCCNLMLFFFFPPRGVPLESIVPSTGVVRETSTVQIF